MILKGNLFLERTGKMTLARSLQLEGEGKITLTEGLCGWGECSVLGISLTAVKNLYKPHSGQPNNVTY